MRYAITGYDYATFLPLEEMSFYSRDKNGRESISLNNGAGLTSKDALDTYPWHKKINAVIHTAGKPVILHSCGNIYPLMDRVIDYLKVDGKHSYEDSILPVEDAWEQYHDRISIIGGIDVDFICRSTPEDIYRRSKAMLERTGLDSGFALGTGNSVPEYVPPENYFAMIRAAFE